MNYMIINDHVSHDARWKVECEIDGLREDGGG